jgi:hypothetical protein
MAILATKLNSYRHIQRVPILDPWQSAQGRILLSISR